MLTFVLLSGLLPTVGSAAPPRASQAYPRAGIVSAPVEGGIRSGQAFNATFADVLAEGGYLEQEFFLAGAASNFGSSSPAFVVPAEPAAEQTAPYVIRILTRRPADPKQFNGTTVVEWSNVTGNKDLEGIWGPSHRYLMRHGYASVLVTAQKAATDQPPISLKYYDPVRYAALQHPGDDYAYDIFAQAAAALRPGRGHGSALLGGLKTKVLLGAGGSQSCGKLTSYVDMVQRTYPLFDGMLPTACNPASYDTSVVKTMWINSESENLASPAARPDSALFRYWDVAGHSHGDWDTVGWAYAVEARDDSSVGGMSGPDVWDDQVQHQYGEQAPASPGPCPANYYPGRYAQDTGIAQLRRWVTDGIAPASAPPLVFEGPTLAKDEFGNSIGGLRSPVLDVPIARYAANVCTLLGSTVPLPQAVLGLLYPSHDTYVRQMQDATTDAVNHGWLEPDDACELMGRAVASTVGGGDPVTWTAPQCQSSGNT
jgi:hypothetical protein